MTGRQQGTGTGAPGTGDPVEARLLAAAASAAWPEVPDLRAPVLARIEAMTPDLRGPVVERIAGTRAAQEPRPRRRPILLGLVLALVGLIAIAGVAAALGFRLPGLDIVLVPSLPPAGSGVDAGSRVPSQSPAGSGFDLGSPVPLEEARAGEPPTLLLPATLPEPTAVWVTGSGDQRVLTVGWRAEPGQPTLEDSDLSLLLMAVEGRADGPYLTKALGPGTKIERVTVDGDPGWWISGPVHELLFPRPGGEAGVLDTRLVGDALVFSREGTLYRLESALGKDATLAIAESLR